MFIGRPCWFLTTTRLKPIQRTRRLLASPSAHAVRTRVTPRRRRKSSEARIRRCPRPSTRTCGSTATLSCSLSEVGASPASPGTAASPACSAGLTGETHCRGRQASQPQRVAAQNPLVHPPGVHGGGGEADHAAVQDKHLDRGVLVRQHRLVQHAQELRAERTEKPLVDALGVQAGNVPEMNGPRGNQPDGAASPDALRSDGMPPSARAPIAPSYAASRRTTRRTPAAGFVTLDPPNHAERRGNQLGTSELTCPRHHALLGVPTPLKGAPR